VKPVSQEEKKHMETLVRKDKELKFWFTKTNDWFYHSNRVLSSIISPDGEYLATLSADETIRMWKMFDRVEDDSVQRQV
jgi:WD40 repeat protein